MRGDDSVSLCRLGARVRHLIARAGGEHSEEHPPTCIASAPRADFIWFPVVKEQPKVLDITLGTKGGALGE